ncbi:unnamed protein product [Rotaria sp. Silwood1]|nr:unnamed protein product [Rotaria sp. Silwood1]CAF4546122.1 unnamed protein product [Rotaria sp. Silwood1]CAF4594286.1 unnamed protein product [Rotaria sp. Silwood1]CAF4640705.1 unnamed protein product [Rotaria sp. Silwood1]CAF4740703.1 unnamed protein product [Rotaria sp. Silwood1]
MAQNQSSKVTTVDTSEQKSTGTIMNCDSTSKQQPELWLPIPLNFKGSELCQIHPSRNLTKLQRAFQPITPIVNDSGEFYPLLANVPRSCFYMKTCSFRDATPPIAYNGIFSTRPPQAQYGMKMCRDGSCRFCYERRDLTHRFEPTINFSNTQVHRFLNKYEVYLNCNVTCTTSNIIYALTCPCRRFDYIGRCVVPFRDRMRDHRICGTRLVANSFLGQIVADRLKADRTPDPTFPEDQNRLYEHSTYCLAALKIFLETHPDFWCFVPMTKEQVAIDDATLTMADRNQLAEYEHSSTLPTETNAYQRDMNLVRWCIKYLAPPPPNYQYSLRQKIEQYEFFREKKECFVSRFLSLYNAAIVIALPENASNAVRHVVQALLIVYAEPKLNITTGVDDTVSISSDADDEIWCKDLIHPRLVQNSLSTSTC